MYIKSKGYVMLQALFKTEFEEQFLIFTFTKKLRSVKSNEHCKTIRVENDVTYVIKNQILHEILCTTYAISD